MTYYSRSTIPAPTAHIINWDSDKVRKNKGMTPGIILLIVDIKMKLTCIEKIVPDQTELPFYPIKHQLEYCTWGFSFGS